MKIIGIQVDRTSLAVVTKVELEKSFNLYYGKMNSLKVGDEMNLGQGYDFSSEIRHACSEMTNAMKSFEAAKNTLMKFAVMVSCAGEKNNEA